jgi:hypothetical protein
MRHLITEERSGNDAAGPDRDPPFSWRGAGQQLMAECGVQIESWARSAEGRSNRSQTRP